MPEVKAEKRVEVNLMTQGGKATSQREPYVQRPMTRIRHGTLREIKESLSPAGIQNERRLEG